MRPSEEELGALKETIKMELYAEIKASLKAEIKAEILDEIDVGIRFSRDMLVVDLLHKGILIASDSTTVPLYEWEIRER